MLRFVVLLDRSGHGADLIQQVGELRLQPVAGVNVAAPGHAEGRVHFFRGDAPLLPLLVMATTQRLTLLAWFKGVEHAENLLEGLLTFFCRPTYPYLSDESQPLLPHGLLSLEVVVVPGRGARLHPGRALVLFGRQEGPGHGRVFAWLGAHLAPHRRFGVLVSADLAHPLKGRTRGGGERDGEK